MATIRLVRHGRATGGWDADVDPGLDDLGVAQAAALADLLGPLGTAAGSPRLVTSPLRRCRETAAPLAARWGVEAVVEAAVTEIPSPEGFAFGERVPWLRQAMTGTWSDLGSWYTVYRDGVAAYVAGLRDDTVITSHFIAINAVIGACTGDDRLVIRSLDNTSVTVVETSPGGMVLVSGGREADTLIRERIVLANATQDWHDTVAIVLVVTNAVAALWALGAHYVSWLRGWPLWIVIAIAQATTLVQAITGTLLMTRDDLEPAPLHALYGFSAIIAVGILYSYRTSPFMRGKQHLLYAAGSFFIMGLGLRELVSLS